MTALVAIILSSPVQAVVVEDLFEVEIPVPDESNSSRHVALSDGLAEVLVRVSGDSHILQRIKPPSPGVYVKQFRYLALETGEQNASTEDQATNQYKLWVQYNGTKIMDLLREQSIPVWGEHRSEAVIWFAVQDGERRYTLRKKDFSQLKNETSKAFKRRGIPVVWPENDTRDQQSLKFADIWAGFAEPLQNASARYSSGPVIAVNMLWNGQFWTGDWSMFTGTDSRRWSLRDRDYDALISKGVDLVANDMGKKFALLEVLDTTKLRHILVQIDNVNSVNGFRKIENYLASLRVVQAVRLSQVEPNRVAFWLALRAEVDDFLRLVTAGSEITPEINTGENTSGGTQNFVYRFTAAP